MTNQESSGSEEFQDPLENYDPPTYRNELERALAEENVAAIHTQPFISIPSDIPVHAALEKLVGLDVACAVVVDNERLVGVFSDRDALDKIALEFDEVKDQPVSKFMTANPVFVHGDDSSAAALCVMAAVGYRHVPVVDADGKAVGIVSPHRVADFLQEHFKDGE